MYRDDLDPSDWRVLLDCYYYAAAAVSVAGHTGPFGHMRETHVVGSGRLGVAATVFPASELVQELAGATTEEFSASITEGAPQGVGPDPVREYYLATAVTLAEEAVEVCGRTLSEADGQTYREWVLQLCAAVAYSAKEGGHLGIGGTPISPPEESAIASIAEALGLPGWQPDPDLTQRAARAARST